MFKVLSIKQEAQLFTLSMMSILMLGCMALAVIVLGAVWAACQAMLLLLSSMVEALSSFGSLYQSSDNFVKLTMLLVIGLALYRGGRPFLRRIVR